MPLRTKILEILEKDARTTVTDIAVMIGEEEEKVRYEIQSMEEDGTILGYKTIINPERTMEDKVGCLIEVSIQPERGFGFDKVAERIYRFPEVQSVFLVSGGYDLLVVIEGKTMREVAEFVMEKLSVFAKCSLDRVSFPFEKIQRNGNHSCRTSRTGTHSSQSLKRTAHGNQINPIRNHSIPENARKPLSRGNPSVRDSRLFRSCRGYAGRHFPGCGRTGFYDFPWHICEAGIHALELGRTSYTANNGVPELAGGNRRVFRTCPCQRLRSRG